MVLSPLLSYKPTSKKTKQPPKKANHKGNIKFLGPLCQMRSGHCYFLFWLFCQVKFSCLPTGLCQIAKSTWPNFQVNIARVTFPSWHIAIWLFGFFAKLPTVTHPVDCLNELQAAHGFLIFWAVKGLNVFRSAQNISRLPPFSFFFSTACLGLTLFPFLLSFFIFNGIPSPSNKS